MGFNFPKNPVHGMNYAPAGGPEYVFSNGAWLQVEGVAGPISGATFFDSMAQAMSSTIAPLPGGPASITLLGYRSSNDGGGAPYNRVSAPPVLHPGWFQSADGAYWELAAPGEVTLEMFGGLADATPGVAPTYPTFPLGKPPTGFDNWDAFQGALAYGKTHWTPTATYAATASIRLLRGKYFVSKTIEIDYSTRISGHGGAGVGNAWTASILFFPINVTAFIYWADATIDTSTGLKHGTNAYGSIIENLRIFGQGGTVWYPTKIDGIYEDHGDATKHGIVMYTTITMRHINIQNFAGNGIHVVAYASGSFTGSANELDFYGVRTVANGGHGLYIEGDNVNAGAGYRIDGSLNGGYGLWDASVAGNLWSGCHFAENGSRSRVHYGGTQYTCLSAALGSTTIPGTNDNVWQFLRLQGRTNFYPDWKLGNKYIPGGAYATVRHTGVEGQTGGVVIGTYIEGTQGLVRLSDDTMVIGGSNQANIRGGVVMTGNGIAEGLSFRKYLSSYLYGGKPGVVTTIGGSDLDAIQLAGNTDVSTTGYAFGRWNDRTQTYDMRYAAVDDGIAMGFTTDGTLSPANAGRGAGISGGRVFFPHALFLGSSLENMRLLTNNPSVPSAGREYGGGDISFNTSADVGNNAAWVCTQGGVVSSTVNWATGNHAVGTVKTSFSKHYRVALNPSNKSMIQPNHTTPGNFTYDDGYTWKFEYDWATIIDWVSDTVYNVDDVVINPAGDAQRLTKKTINWSSKNYVYLDTAINSENNHRYRCTKVPVPLVVSAHKPDHIISTVVPIQAARKLYPDGYEWADLGLFVSTVSPRCTSIRPVLDEVDGYSWRFVGGSITTAFWAQGKIYGEVLVTGRTDENLVQTIDGRGYSCVDTSDVLNSIVAPIHDKTIIGSDGYGWTFLDSGNSTGVADVSWELNDSYNINVTVRTIKGWSGANYAIGQELTSLNGHLYRCVVDPGGATLSANAPSHLGYFQQYTEEDGYRWQHLGLPTLASWVSQNYRFGQELTSTNGFIYRCTLDPGAIVSTVPPIHGPTAPLEVTGADGYKWLYLGNPASPLWVTGTIAVNAERLANGRLYRCIAAGTGASTIIPHHFEGLFTDPVDGYTWLYIYHSLGANYKCTVVPGSIKAVTEPVHTTGTVSTPEGYSWQHEIALWITGTNYVLGNRITTAGGFCYQCTSDPAGVALSTIQPSHGSSEVINPGKSTVAPVHLSGTNVPGVDGYEWTYLATATGTAWVANTVYTVGDIRKNAAHDYQLTARPAGDGYGWTVMTNGTAATDFWPLWISGTNYVDNANITGLDGKRYRCTEDAPTGVVSTVAPTRIAWVTGTNYAVGDRRVASNGILYVCTTDPGAVLLSTMEPKHISGTVLNNAAGGDDYGWMAIGIASKQIVETDSFGWTPIPTWITDGRYISQDIVVGSNSRPYKQTVAAPKQLSIIKPTHSDTLVYSDGYIWHHLNNTYAQWDAFGEIVSQLDISSNEALTLIPQTTPREIRHTGTLSANRVVTLDKTDAYNGMRYRIARTGGNQNGVYTLNIGAGVALATLRTGDWCDVTYSTVTGAWYLSAFGQLIDARNQQTINTDDIFTLTPNTSPQDTLHTGILSATRVVTLSVTGAAYGQQFRITRTGGNSGGTWFLNVSNGTPVTLLKAMPTGSWGTYIFDGTVWYLGAYGTL